MKKAIKITLTILLATTLFSCSKNEIEVVTQDTSYQLDPGSIFVDIPKEFKFDPSNIAYLSGQTNLTLNAENILGNTTIKEGNTFTFKVKIKKVLDKDVIVKLAKNDELLKEYAGDKDQFIGFPEGTYSVSEGTLSAGKTDVDLTLTFSDLNKLNTMPGYLLPLRLEIKDAANELKVSTMFYSVFVKLNLVISNIDSSNAPIEGTAFNSTITFASNKASGLEVMKDGNAAGGTWYPTNNSTYLNINLPQTETIKGIRINTVSGQYQLASMRILTLEDGKYVSQGKFSIQQQATILYVKFAKPISTQSIRFEEMLTLNGGSQPDLAEVNLIK